MIYHDHDQKRFYTIINGMTAYLSYDVIGQDHLDYHHTVVPPKLGGQGIGSQLVKYALDYARTHNQKISPSCSFVARYIDKHAIYQDLLG